MIGTKAPIYTDLVTNLQQFTVYKWSDCSSPYQCCSDVNCCERFVKFTQKFVKTDISTTQNLGVFRCDGSVHWTGNTCSRRSTKRCCWCCR